MANTTVSKGQTSSEKFIARAEMILNAIYHYVKRKFLQTIGLELTESQKIYWKAIQRRMVLGRLEDLIDTRLLRKRIKPEEIQIPYELFTSIVRNDEALFNYLRDYLAIRGIDVIRQDSESTDGTGSVQSRIIKPSDLAKEMMLSEESIENEEELLVDRGSCLTQGFRAMKLLIKKVRDMWLASRVKPVDEIEETDDVPLLDSFVLDNPNDDDDDDLMHDDLIDNNRSQLKPVKVIESQDAIYINEEWLKVGGKSRRKLTYWQSLNEWIPFVVSNFRFKHIVREKIYSISLDSKDQDVVDKVLILRKEEDNRNKEITNGRHLRLKNLWKKASSWPLFTYWLMFVQTVILIISLSVYGLGPFGYVPFTEVALVQQSDLSVDVVGKEVAPNIWLGPPQSALILLGANYGPCMRRDRLLFEAIERDRNFEASQSGCCVRRDGSGCVQVATEGDCPNTGRSTDFIFYDPLIDTSAYTNRSVCGSSPRTCLSPPASNSAWQVDSISDWPICKDSFTPNTSDTDNSHLTCDVTGRPCCIGIQAECMITTQENCDFLEGRFHEDAFLCSQVDCISAKCGLTPFSEPDNPDQVQRLGLALFLHAGIFHLPISLIFEFIVLRNLEKYLGWLSTTILYLGSGIGGNIVSGIFVPYSPEVGPSAATFGVIAFFLVFIIYHWDMLYNPVQEVIKYVGIIVVLILVGLLPYIDNYARVGGMIFGTFFSFIHVHFIPRCYQEGVWSCSAFEEYKKFREKIGDKNFKLDVKSNKDKRNLKIAFIVVGVVCIVLLFIVSFLWFYEFQRTWNGFTYFNCIIPTQFSELCRDFTQNVRPRASSLATS